MAKMVTTVAAAATVVSRTERHHLRTRYGLLLNGQGRSPRQRELSILSLSIEERRPQREEETLVVEAL